MHYMISIKANKGLEITSFFQLTEKNKNSVKKT